MCPVRQAVPAVLERAQPGILRQVPEGGAGPRQQRRDGQRSDIHFLVHQRVPFVSRVRPRGSFITRVNGGVMA